MAQEVPGLRAPFHHTCNSRNSWQILQECGGVRGIRGHEQPTNRCSGRGPAAQLRHESNIRGGWSPPLTFALGARGMNLSRLLVCVLAVAILATGCIPSWTVPRTRTIGALTGTAHSPKPDYALVESTMAGVVTLLKSRGWEHHPAGTDYHLPGGRFHHRNSRSPRISAALPRWDGSPRTSDFTSGSSHPSPGSSLPPRNSVQVFGHWRTMWRVISGASFPRHMRFIFPSPERQAPNCRPSSDTSRPFCFHFWRCRPGALRPHY